MELNAVSVLLIIFQVLVAVVMMLLKNNLDTHRQDLKALQERQQYFQDNYAKRDELREIKQDISDRLDRFERNIKEWMKL